MKTDPFREYELYRDTIANIVGGTAVTWEELDGLLTEMNGYMGGNTINEHLKAQFLTLRTILVNAMDHMRTCQRAEQLRQDDAKS